MTAFALFGPGHLIALAITAAVTVALISVVRKWPAARGPVRRSLALALLAVMLVALVWLRRAGIPWGDLAPLQLCDVAVFVAAWALLSMRPLAAEVAYLWGAAGTLLAVITPDVGIAFPSPEFVLYFAQHGLVIVAAFFLPFGLGLVPRRGAVWRVLLITNVYAVAVAVVNVAFHTNFLYLCHRPPHPTPLDWFGPWPVYLLVCELVAVLLFASLCLPFRRR